MVGIDRVNSRVLINRGILFFCMFVFISLSLSMLYNKGGEEDSVPYDIVAINIGSITKVLKLQI